MDAWEILVSKSTIQSGDSWEHLNNQAGGGQTQNHYIEFFDLTLDDMEYSLELDDDLILEIDDTETILEIEEDYTLEVD